MTINLLMFATAVYGALLSTSLALLAYRRERRRIGLLFRLEMLGGPNSLSVYVINRGQRAVTIIDCTFIFRGEVGGYKPKPWDGAELPKKLADGDELALRFDIDEVYPAVEGFAVEDSHRREHRQYFTEDFARQLTLFRDAFGTSDAAPSAEQ